MTWTPLDPLSLVPSHVAGLPPFHLFTNTGGRKEGPRHLDRHTYPPHTRPCQRTAGSSLPCAPKLPPKAPRAHFVHTTRKLEWRLNTRISWAYGPSVNTLQCKCVCVHINRWAYTFSLKQTIFYKLYITFSWKGLLVHRKSHKNIKLWILYISEYKSLWSRSCTSQKIHTYGENS